MSSKERNLKETGISCTGCDHVLGNTTPLKSRRRLIECGACHRTFHYTDDGRWTFVPFELENGADNPELKQLLDKFAVHRI